MFQFIPSQEYMEAWRTYLQGCAGVPELEACGLRSIHPGIWLPAYDIPFPSLPPPPDEEKTVRVGLLEDLIADMRVHEDRLSGLRQKTADLFGKTFMARWHAAHLRRE